MNMPIIFNPPFGSAASFPLLAPDGSQSTPPYSFASDPDTGFYVSSPSVGLIDIAVGGNQRYQFSPSRFQMGRSQQLAWASALTPGVVDTILVRDDAANTLAQRNGTNPQAFRVYNTYTDASNYERGRFAWDSNTLYIGSNNAGTGIARNVEFQRGGALRIRFEASVVITFNGHLQQNVDNTYDIGASGANRPRNGFFAGYVVQGVVAVASLPAAATAGAGARMIVNDANAPTFGTAVAGGGAAVVPVYSDGSSWLVG